MTVKINSQRVKLAVIQSKQTVKDIASRAGINKHTLSQALKEGARCKLPTIGKLADALNIPVKDLICT